VLTLVVGLTTGIWRMGDGDGSRIGEIYLFAKHPLDMLGLAQGHGSFYAIPVVGIYSP
jgi:hypothetical protein